MTHKTISIVLAIITLIALSQAPAQADWAEEALLLQEQLDVNNPLNRTLWVGTHNSYNSIDWDGWAYIDANQTLSPKNQLRSGARELTYDVIEFYDQLRLCHGDPCGGQEKKFRDGLRQIRDFIDEGNQNSVILLKLELNDFFGQTAFQLGDILGDYIYQPDIGVVPDDGSCSGGHGLEPEYLTKADVLKAGKNVVVVYAAGSLVPCDEIGSLFKEYVHIGLEYEAEGWSKKFSKPGDTTECGELYAQGKMTRIHDGNTWWNVGGGGAVQSFTGSGDTRQYMRCGLNVLEFFNYDGDATYPGIAADDFYDPKPEHLVWSWDENEPSGNGDCAVMSSDSNRFRDEGCNQSFRFACYSEADDNWKLTSASGIWEQGEQICSDEHGAEGYVFAVPTNAPQMYALELLQDSLNSGSAWVDYHDLSDEGVWQANNDVELTIHDEYGEFGNIYGTRFDERYMIERSLQTGDLRTIQSVRIKAGARVDGFEVIYSDGTTIHHGGYGGSWSNTLRLASDEHIELWDVCLGSYNGTNRIFYLALQTNLGQRISGGTGATGNCTWKFVDHPIYAFYGKAGNELDSIGFYTVDVENDGRGDEPVIHDEYGEFGDNYGVGYNDRFWIEQGIAGDNLRQITEIYIFSGARVNGFKVVYSDGTIIHRGGGGDWRGMQVDAENGEYINFFDICVGQKNGTDRVFYLKFRTNWDRWISGGTGGLDSCTYHYFDQPLYGFYGTAGDELDSIGFYTVEGLATHHIDDADATTHIFGNWSSVYSTGAVRGSHKTSTSTDGGFLWRFEPTVSGWYDVSAFWIYSSDLGVADYWLTTNPFSADETMVTKSWYQRYTGGQYNDLFAVYLEAGTTYYLAVGSESGDEVIADNVRFERVD